MEQARPLMQSRRWIMWAILALGFFLMSFTRVTTGVLSGELTRAFDLTATELSLLHSSFFYIYAILQLPAGLLLDRYGTRRVGSIGILSMSVGIVAFAFSGSFLAGFLARALAGLGGSVLYLATLRFAANWFRVDEFATVSGLSIAGAGLGGVAATTPLAIAVNAVGWRTAILASGGLGLTTGLAVYLVVRDSPAAAGVPAPDGVTAEQPAANRATVARNARRILSSLDSWLLGAVLFLTLGTNLTIMGLWGVPYLVHVYGLSVTDAASIILLGNLGIILGAPLFGWVSDRTGSRLRLVLFGTVVFAIGYSIIAVTGAPPLPLVGAIFLATSFVTGATVLVYTIIKERYPVDASGAATGALNSIGYVGAALVPAAMGVALDTYWTGKTVAGTRIYSLTGYRIAFTAAALASILAVLCVTAVYLRSSPGHDTPRTDS